MLHFKLLSLTVYLAFELYFLKGLAIFHLMLQFFQNSLIFIQYYLFFQKFIQLNERALQYYLIDLYYLHIAIKQVNYFSAQIQLLPISYKYFIINLIFSRKLNPIMK